MVRKYVRQVRRNRRKRVEVRAERQAVHETLSELPALVQQHLEEKGWTANHLAKVAGVAQSTVSRLFHSHHQVGEVVSVHPGVLRVLCKVLGIDYLQAFKAAGFIPKDYQPLRVDEVVIAENQMQEQSGLWVSLAVLAAEIGVPGDGKDETQGMPLKCGGREGDE